MDGSVGGLVRSLAFSGACPRRYALLPFCVETAEGWGTQLIGSWRVDYLRNG
jgi:hypothetical protein